MAVKTQDEIKALFEDLRLEKEALEKKERALQQKEEELKELLAKAARMSVDEAKKTLLDEVSKELTAEIARKIRQAEERTKLESGEKAKEILVDAMRHGATNYTAEYTVSTVVVPNEGCKREELLAPAVGIFGFLRKRPAVNWN